MFTSQTKISMPLSIVNQAYIAAQLTYGYTPTVTTEVQAVNRSWIPSIDLLQPLFKPMLVHVRLPNGIHYIAPLQKKLNSNLYELLFPNQLLVWKDLQGGGSNA